MNLAVLHEFRPFNCVLQKFVTRYLPRLPTTYKPIIAKSLREEHSKRTITNVYNFLVTDVRENATKDNRGIITNELQLVHLVRCKENYYEYVHDEIIPVKIGSEATRDANIFASLKKAVSLAEKEFRIKIKYAMIDYWFDASTFDSEFKVIISPSKLVESFQDIDFEDEVSRLTPRVQQNLTESIKQFSIDGSLLLKKIRNATLSVAIVHLILFVVDTSVYLPSHVGTILQNMVKSYVDGTLLICALLQPATKDFMARIPDYLVSFREALQETRRKAIEKEQNIDRRFADFGFYTGKHGEVFPKICYTGENFWFDASIIDAYGYLASFALNLTNIPASPPKLDVSSIVKQFDSRKFDETSIRLFKILFVKCETGA